MRAGLELGDRIVGKSVTTIPVSSDLVSYRDFQPSDKIRSSDISGVGVSYDCIIASKCISKVGDRI